MKLEVDFDALRVLADRMRAPEQTFSLIGPNLQPLDEVYLELKKGLDVDIDDVDFNSLDLPTYQGHHVLLYIKDHATKYWATLEDPNKGNRFHICHCGTLESMKRLGRYKRYVATNDTSGQFLITDANYFGKNNEKRTPLLVCINCIHQLNYKRARRLAPESRRELTRTFRLDEFFATYSTVFKYLPKVEGDRSPASVSTEDLHLSQAYRESVRYRCEKCAIDLSAYPTLLHVVPRNKNRRNDTDRIALCIDCHSKANPRPPILVSGRERELVATLRAKNKRGDTTRKRPEWKEAYDLAPTSLHGLMDELEVARGWAAPEVDWEIADKGRVCARVDLAWPGGRKAVVLERSAETEKLEQLGWKVYTVQDLLK